MNSGKHKTYTLYVYVTDDEADYAERIKAGINQALGTKGHVNRVEENDAED